MEQVGMVSFGSTDDHIDHNNHDDHIKGNMPLDFDDPHRAALEDNPERAQKLTLSTALAVLVRTVANFDCS